MQNFLKLRGVNVLAVASAAVATQLLDGGRTADSTFKIPISVIFESTFHIAASSQNAEKLNQMSFIIWDKIVIFHRHNLKAVDRMLRNILRSILLFGAKAVQRIRDFQQILPVVRAASRFHIVATCFKKSLFQNFKRLNLQQNMCLQAL